MKTQDSGPGSRDAAHDTRTVPSERPARRRITPEGRTVPVPARSPRPRLLLTALALLGPALAQAQIAAPAVTPTAAPDGPSMLPMIVALVFVLALIPAAIWLLKRMGGSTLAGTGGLRVVGQLTLGARERLVVVEAGERWLLLGVTAGSINRVGTLPKGALPLPPTGAANFSALLNAARGNSRN